MLLPELRRNGRLDMDKLLKQREALNQAVEEAETPDSSQMQTVSKAATGQKTQAIPKAQATQNVQMTESNTQETIEGKRKTRADSEKNTGEQINLRFRGGSGIDPAKPLNQVKIMFLDNRLMGALYTNPFRRRLILTLL